jgi:hypothetical protein
VKIYIRSIAVALVLSLTPLTNAAAIPDFTDPTLPTIVSFSQWIDINNKGEITFYTETSLRWKKNRPTIFAGSMGILENKNGEPAQPCYAIGNVDNGFGSVRKLGGNSIEITPDQILKETIDGDFKITTYLFSQSLEEPVKSPHTPFEWNYCRGIHRPLTIGIYDETGRIKTFFDQRFNSEPLPGVSVSQYSYFWYNNPKYYPCPPANPALQEGYHAERSICDSINPFVSGITVSDSLFIEAKAAREKYIAEEKAEADRSAAQRVLQETFLASVGTLNKYKVDIAKLFNDYPSYFQQNPDLKASLQRAIDYVVPAVASQSEVDAIRDLITGGSKSALASDYLLAQSGITKYFAAEAAKSKIVRKATTITCVKGKLTKKLTAVNPKCPAGYKKK